MSQEYRSNVLEKYRRHPHVPVDFSWTEYLRLNPGLVDKGFDNEAQALRHWIKTGRKHNLKYKLKPGEVFVPPNKTPVPKQHTRYIVEDRKKREVVRENHGEKYKIWRKHSDPGAEHDTYFEKILTMLREGEAFSFIRFCDGEYHNMFTRTSPDRKIDEKHMPMISRSLLGVLELKKKSLEHGEKNNLLVSMQHGTDYDKQFRAYLHKYELVTQEGYPSSLFSWAYVTDRILDMFYIINKSERPLVLVGPDYLSKISVLAPYFHIKTPSDLSWVKQESIEKELFGILDDLVYSGKNPIVLYACSITGKMALAKAYQQHSQIITQIDMGSNLSPFCGVVTRGWQKPEKFTMSGIQDGRKAYCVSIGDRTGSQINEEIFSFAYCVKNHLDYVGCLDKSEIIDKDGPRFDKHLKLSKFLNLPLPEKNKESFSNYRKIQEDDYSRSSYPDVNELLDDLFINRLQGLYYSQQRVSEPPNNLQVAVHIRRGDVRSDNAMRYIPQEYYLEKIRLIREIDPRAEIRVFTESIYSLSKDEERIINDQVQEDFSSFEELGCVMMIDTDIQEAWHFMIHADVFLMAKSSFSWVPAIYNRNFVVYHPAWYQKINRWHSSEDPQTWNQLRDYIINRKIKKNKEIKLNLGCGEKTIEGYINIDSRALPKVDLVSDITDLSFFDNESVSVIYASHVLEHFGRHEYMEVLQRWYELLKPGGILRIAVPDLEKVFEHYIKNQDAVILRGFLYGGQTYKNNYHYCGWDYEALASDLKQVGFQEIVRYDWRKTEHSEVDDFSQCYLPHMEKETGTLMSLNIEAKK